MTEQRRFEGRTVILFGAGSDGEGWGNGKAAAVQYAREGGRVFAVDLNKDAVAETRDIIRGEGGECEIFKANASVSSDVEAAVTACLASFGRIDALHNNVGLAVLGGAMETSLESWKRVMDVNLKTILLTTKHIIPIMDRQGGGAIVNTSSIAAVRWSGAAYIGYYASKRAVNQMTRVIAGQHARRRIRCNTIMPGLIDTPQTYKHVIQHYGGGDAAKMAEARRLQVPMKKQGSAWDIAKAAAFLNSDEARFVTGALLTVDGGMICSMVAPPPNI